MSEEIIEAIRHPKRRLILELLAQKGPLTFSELMELTEISRSSALAFHLRKLKGLIEKKNNIYMITDTGLEALSVIKSTKKLTFRQVSFWTITGTPINTISMITQIILFLYFLYVALRFYEATRYFSMSSDLTIMYGYEIIGILASVIWSQTLSIWLFNKLDAIEKIEVGIKELIRAFLVTPYFYSSVYLALMFSGILYFDKNVYHLLEGLMISFALVLPTTLNFEEVKYQSKLSIKFLRKRLVCYLTPIL